MRSSWDDAIQYFVTIFEIKSRNAHKFWNNEIAKKSYPNGTICVKIVVALPETKKKC